jgi:hypothetical protein
LALVVAEGWKLWPAQPATPHWRQPEEHATATWRRLDHLDLGTDHKPSRFEAWIELQQFSEGEPVSLGDFEKGVTETDDRGEGGRRRRWRHRGTPWSVDLLGYQGLRGSDGKGGRSLHRQLIENLKTIRLKAPD